MQTKNIYKTSHIILTTLLWLTLGSIAMAASSKNDPYVLWHHNTTGAIKVTAIKNMLPQDSIDVVTSSNANLLPRGMGDFTGDGKQDYLFHNQNSGMVRVWEMNNTKKMNNIAVMDSSNTNLKVAGVGDFDGDGDRDIATFNTSNGALRIWEMEGTDRVSNVLVLSGLNTNLQPRGAGDMDGDGIDDLVLRNNNSGAVRVWTMNDDFTRKGNVYVTGSSNTNLELRGVVDINKDGHNDILNYNTNTGVLRAWLMDGEFGIGENPKIDQNTDLEWSVRGGYFLGSDFTLTLDINESTATGDWKKLSSSKIGSTAEVTQQGNYGTCVITEDSIIYLKTVKTNESDSCLLNVSTGTRNIEINVSVESLYWKMISAGSDYTTGIKSNGSLWSWGDDDDGKLGYGGGRDSLVPVQEYSQSTNWILVSAGNNHTVALKSDGTLWAWGDNRYGELGDGTESTKYTPIQEASKSTDWAHFDAGGGHTVAIKNDGTLWAWGLNNYGQLGDGTTEDKLVPTQEISQSTNWSSISIGGLHTVALKIDGTLWSWGRNSDGQLGDGTTENKHVPVQEDSQSADWRSLSAGAHYTVAIKSDRTLWAWGTNYWKQLGNERGTDKLVPTQEETQSSDWESVSAGTFHTVATKTDGTLWTWGQNTYGQFGNNSTIYRSFVPTQEAGKSIDWNHFDAGGGHTAAIKKDGTLWMWGVNRFGQLGNGTTTIRLLPSQEVDEATTWVYISGSYGSTVAIKSDGTLWGWGANWYGQLGNGTTISRVTPTQEVSQSTTWSSVSTYSEHTVAIKMDGTLWAWGENGFGQLGDNTTTDRLVPTQEASGSTAWSSVSCGYRHTAAIKTDGTLWAWGSNWKGMLGDGTTDRKYVPTQEVTQSTNWNFVSTGGAHTIAIKTDGTLWAWGYNAKGQLGNGTITEKLIPTQEDSNSTDWVSVSGGHEHTAAIKSDGTLWAWGNNDWGNLGDQTYTDRLVPTQEASQSTNWSLVSAGFYHTIAIRSNGTLWGWGYNSYGQTGDGTRSTTHSVPTQEATHSTDWSSARATRSHHTVAIKSDGTLWGWGYNAYGQLGNYGIIWTPTQPQPRKLSGGGSEF